MVPVFFGLGECRRFFIEGKERWIKARRCSGVNGVNGTQLVLWLWTNHVTVFSAVGSI